MGNSWCDESISLQLDHINGIRDDNRLENLRILCPNCHSQTSTFCGRRKKINIFCLDCGKVVSNKKSKRCVSCAAVKVGISQRHFDISKEELEKLVWEKPTERIGKDFGVSGKAVEKRCKKFGIEKPPRGYWMKNRPILTEKD
jgi:Zn finger protein HypA/HybF involved in hydrogenase expression